MKPFVWLIFAGILLTPGSASEPGAARPFAFFEPTVRVSAVINSLVTPRRLSPPARDLLGGLFGGLKRAVIEDRIETEGPALMREIRRRHESSSPAAEGGER